MGCYRPRWVHERCAPVGWAFLLEAMTKWLVFWVLVPESVEPIFGDSCSSGISLRLGGCEAHRSDAGGRF